MKEMNDELKKIIDLSKDEAIHLGNREILPEHIILSILSYDNETTKLLNLNGINTSELYDEVSLLLMKNYANFNIVVTNDIPLSSEAKFLLRDSERICKGFNENKIKTTHMFLSILKNKTWGVVKLMDDKFNLSYETFSEFMGYTDGRRALTFDEFKNLFANESIDKSNFMNKNNKNKTKTPALDKFCRDVTSDAENGKIDPVIGRDVEIKRVAQILSRRKKNNPVLIGEAGVGKTSIVEGLALLITNGDAPRPLLDKRILSLDLSSLIAGTKYRGQFEERMTILIKELIENPNIIIFIDELHTIVGAGNTGGAMDAANIFKPSLTKGEIQIIGATTYNEYREYIEKDGALMRRFQEVKILEPSLDETHEILNKLKERYEDYHKVIYSDEAIEECVKLSDRYITDRFMPDKAIDLMDEAGASINVNKNVSDTIKKLEEKKNEIKQKKIKVVKEQKYELAAQLRDEEKKVEEDLKKAKEEWEKENDKNRPIITPSVIANVVSDMTGIPVSEISTEENKKLLKMGDELKKFVIGQDHAIDKITKAVKRNRLGIRDKSKPIGTFIFLGPTGVGKTLLAKEIAKYLFGSENSLIRIDMSEYKQPFNVSRLIGSPPGYVGYEQGGQLTEKVRRNPYSVILFDEIEKAHESVFDIMLQIFDDGKLTDGLGRTINFKNTLIILTSNIGVRELNDFGLGSGFKTEAMLNEKQNFEKRIIEKSLKNKFRPEFLNRLDDIIIFNSLSKDVIDVIVHNELSKLKHSLNEIGYNITFSKKAIEFLSNVGYNEKYGARELNRVIQRFVEDKITDALLGGVYDKNKNTIKVGFDSKKSEIILR